MTRPDGGLRAVIGTMGGDTQPQILLQLLTRLLHHGQSAGHGDRGAAVGAPSSRRRPGSTPGSTPTRPSCTSKTRPRRTGSDGLRDRGHDVEVVEGVTGTFGHAQLIEVTDAGLAGAADPRALVGAAVGY